MNIGQEMKSGKIKNCLLKIREYLSLKCANAYVPRILKPYRSYFILPMSTEQRAKYDHNALWSYPASGNHWLRFIVEYLSGLPTHGHDSNQQDTPIFMNKFPGSSRPLSHVNGRHPYILYKSHDIYPLTNQSTLIFLIRDFREHMARGILRYHYYMSLIRTYDSFFGTKMLIYYEDLMLKPKREILRVKNFLGGSESCYKTFMNHYDDYTELSRNAKKRNWRNHISGTNITFHQNQLSEEDIAKRSEHFQQWLATSEYRHLKPYIARYME